MRPGDRILDRYVIDSPAGSGAMGVVFRAIDLANRQPVAIKVLRDPWSDGIRRFKREAEVLRELSDPRIVGYLADGITQTGEAFLVMEWLEGVSLQERLDRGPITARDAVSVARSVAEALVVAHARNVIHRDLKPANIFLVGASVERVKVVDFGIAQMRKSGQTLTATGEILGTPAYMSPEQASSSRELDARSDLFSLGSILFECLSGRSPFERPGALAVLIALATERAPLLRSVAPNVPPRVAELVDALLSPDPDFRPPHAQMVVDALRAFEADSASFPYLATLIAHRPSPAGMSLPQSFSTGPTLSPTTVPYPGAASGFGTGRNAALAYSDPRALAPKSRATAVVAVLGGIAFLGLVALGIVLKLGLVSSSSQLGSASAEAPPACGPATKCVRLESDDYHHVDAFAILPQLMEIAESVRPGTKLSSLQLVNVVNGWVDLDRQGDGIITVYTTDGVMLDVKHRSVGVWTSAIHFDPYRKPGCSLAQAFAAAVAGGLPKHGAANVSVGGSNTPDTMLFAPSRPNDAGEMNEVTLSLKSCAVVHLPSGP